MTCEWRQIDGRSVMVCSRRPTRQGRPSRQDGQTPAGAVDLRRIDWLLANAEACEARLSARERSFVDDVARRRGAYGDRIRISERQMAWLEDIVRRVA